MNKFITFLGLIALSSAQFEAPVTKWTGPIADHMIGHLVHDTPEVAAAKSQHLQAHQEVLQVLPELPPEIRYQQTGLAHVPTVAPFIPQHVAPVHNFGVPQVHSHVAPSVAPHFTQFAEEIPRSSIGETPEVAAARAAHLAAHHEISSILPVVKSVESSFGAPAVPTHFFPNHGGNQPQYLEDTPEVKAAKEAHARAVAALG